MDERCRQVIQREYDQGDPMGWWVGRWTGPIATVPGRAKTVVAVNKLKGGGFELALVPDHMANILTMDRFDRITFSNVDWVRAGGLQLQLIRSECIMEAPPWIEIKS